MQKSQWFFIVNPNAGAGKCRKEWPHIETLLSNAGLVFNYAFTERRLHAMVLSRNAIAAGHRNIVAVGGDGTLHEVINGVFAQSNIPSHEITIGMIPVGTGNDWSRMYNIPHSYEEAIRILNQQNTFIQDVGLVVFHLHNKQNRRYFMNIAGMGFDAMVVERTNKLKDKGKGSKLAYLLNIISGLFGYRYFKAEVEVDGVNSELEIFSMSVGICKYNGGGMLQLPDAIPNDGRFDLTIIKRIGRFNVIRSLPRLYNGTIKKHPRVIALTGSTVRIKSKHPVSLETDGESLGFAPVEFEIIPSSLKVITGKKTA